MHRLSAPRQHYDAVTFDMLQAIVQATNMSSTQHRVLFYCLQINDVIVQDSNGSTTKMFATASTVVIILRGSKTDQVGNGIRRTLLKGERAPVCPVFAALLLQRNATILKLPQNAPICSFSRSNVLSAETMTTVLRRAAKAGNINPQKISTHSLRSGGATAMHTAGVDADTIRMHGRWASDAYRAYVHEAPAAVLHLAKRMGTTSSTPTRTDQEHGASRAQELV
ncbi:hypothetical protein JG687_00017241 [Phytophthora cactorum]|uniref:Tyr recombinase domain-containing protein n=2 Tax=Phytophthora cactorum TaxID=29920 RepID=A0A8T1TQC7_9STRA|nr:hypothetical protein JG687_00017241 [Phytophthora cactorum]